MKNEIGASPVNSEEFRYSHKLVDIDLTQKTQVSKRTDRNDKEGAQVFGWRDQKDSGRHLH